MELIDQSPEELAALAKKDAPLPAAPETPQANWFSTQVPQEKVQEFATKYKVDPSEIQNLFSMQGAIYQSAEEEKAAREGNAQLTGDSVLDALRSPEIKAIPEQAIRMVPNMANSILLGLPWKVMRESSNNPAMYDEIETEAKRNRGYIQRGSELLVEMPTGSKLAKLAFTPLLNKLGVASKVSAATKSAGSMVTDLFGGGNIGKLAGSMASAAVSGIPTSLSTGAVGALAGYAGSRRGDEAENMLKYGALFAAFPYAASAGAATAGYVLARPLSKLASMIGIKKTETLANFSAAIDTVKARSEQENLLLDIARRKTTLEDITEKQVDTLTSMLGIKNKEISTLAKNIESENAVFEAKKILVREQADKKLADFAEEFLPLRTNVREVESSMNTLVNDFAGITDAEEMTRYMAGKKDVAEKVGNRISAALQKGDVERAKEILFQEHLLPEFKTKLDAGKMNLASKEDVRTYIDLVDKTQGQSEGYMQNLWTNYRAADLLKKTLKNKAINYNYSTVENIFNWVGTKEHVLDDIDRRWGIDELAYAHGKFMRMMDKFKTISPALKEDVLVGLSKKYRENFLAKMQGFEDEALFVLYQENKPRALLRRAQDLGLYDGEVEALAKFKSKGVTRDDVLKMFMPEDKAATLKAFSGEYADSMETLRSSAKAMFDVNIGKTENYFRHQLVGNEEAIYRLINRSKEIDLESMRGMKPKQFKQELINNGKLRELQRATKYLYQTSDLKSPSFKTAGDLLDAIDQYVMNPTVGSNRLSPVIYSAYERKGGMPLLLRETDPIKVASSWVDNTLRAIFTREPLADISKYIPILQKLGAKSDADYLKDYVRNALGRRADATLFSSNVSRLRRVRGLADKFAGNQEEFERVLNAPEQVQNVLKTLLHSNMLSSPFTALRNLEQIPFAAATELGGQWGQKLALQSSADVVGSLVARKIDIEDLMFRGRLPSKFRGDIYDALTTPAKGVLNKVTKATDAYSNTLMYVFGKAEMFQRLVSIRSGVRAAEDAIAGRKEALDFIRNITSPSWKKEITKSLAAGNKAELGEKIGDYITERAMYNYSKANISRAAEFIGPLLGMFSRFSTEVSADIVNKLRAGQGQFLIEKYLYPTLYMTMMYKGLKKATEDSSSASNRVNAILGASMKSHIPLSSATGLIDIWRQPTPVVQAAIDAYNLVGGSKQEWTKAFTTVTNFLPVVRPAQNWVDTFAAKAIMGMDKGDAPIGKVIKEEIRQPVINKILGD
jgi:hypothetical protein